MNVYQRIKKAAIKGTALRLTADEAWSLYWGDDAIKQVADESDGWEGTSPDGSGGAYEDQAKKAAMSDNDQGRPQGGLMKPLNGEKTHPNRQRA